MKFDNVKGKCVDLSFEGKGVGDVLVPPLKQ